MCLRCKETPCLVTAMGRGGGRVVEGGVLWKEGCCGGRGGEEWSGSVRLALYELLA